MKTKFGRLGYGTILFSIAAIVVIASVAYFFSVPAENDAQKAQSLMFLSRLSPSSGSAATTQQVVLGDGDLLQLDAEPVYKEVGGSRILMYGYNGQIPGPTIRVKQGSALSVNFTNKLPFETTVHWHGLRLDNRFDGVPMMTQDPIAPGGSFLYELRFPDAGPYWYHPHVREDLQQELGLYGGIVVEPSDSGYYGPVDREEFLFLDDIKISGGDVPTFSNYETNFALMGRFGDMFLLNGDEDYILEAVPGKSVRIYLADSAGSRTFNFSIEGHVLKVAGMDGGRVDPEFLTDSVLVSPGERVVVEAVFNDAGVYGIFHTTPYGRYRLGEVKVSDGPSGKNIQSIGGYDDIGLSDEEIGRYTEAEPDYSVELDMIMGQMSGMAGGGHEMHGGMMGGAMDFDGDIEWEDGMQMMNSMSTDGNVRWIIRDAASGRENDGATYDAKVGDLKKLRIFNRPDSMHPMQHPIHLHGQRFLVLAEDGTENEAPVWKDVVLVPKGKTVDLLVEFSNPGEWAIHCHIPEHMESGMMSSFSVSE